MADTPNRGRKRRQPDSSSNAKQPRTQVPRTGPHHGDAGAGESEAKVERASGGDDHHDVYLVKLFALLTAEHGSTIVLRLSQWWLESANPSMPFTLGGWKQFYANPCWASGAPPASWAEHRDAVHASLVQAHATFKQAATDGAGADGAGAAAAAGAGAAGADAAAGTAQPVHIDTVQVGNHKCPVSLANTLPQFQDGTVQASDYEAALEHCKSEIHFVNGELYYTTFNTAQGATPEPQLAPGAGVTETKGVEAGAGDEEDDSVEASAGDEENKGVEAGAGDEENDSAEASAGDEESKGVEAGAGDDAAPAASCSGAQQPRPVDPTPAQPPPTSTGDEGAVAVLWAQLQHERAQLQHERARRVALARQVKQLKHHSSAAALVAKCPRVDLEELAAIVGREPDPDQAPWPALVHSDTEGPDGSQRKIELSRSVFGIQHVHNIAGRVLNDSTSTPAGILRSLLKKVATPEQDLNADLLSRVVAYITEEATRRRWPSQKMAHLATAAATARLLNTSTLRNLVNHKGKLTLECMQVTPIVRQPLAVVFGQLHGDVPLSRAMLALVEKQDTTPPDTPADTTQAGDSSSLVAASEGSTKAAERGNPRRGENANKAANQSRVKTIAEHNKQFAGGDLRAKPDLAVFMEHLVFALGETKAKAEHMIPELDRYKLACMSAAACGSLQLKIMRSEPCANGNCHCGDPESLFPIPLIESYRNVLRLYYGKTLHDREGGKCQHRVGCFFRLTMMTWADALLALSVMQAVADDMYLRWRKMKDGHKRSAQNHLVGLRPVTQAHTPKTHRTRTRPTQRSHGGRSQAKEATVPHADMAALQAAGVADVKPLFPPPMLVIYEAGDAPPDDNDRQWRRVYRGTWTDNGATSAVIVKVVSRRQAAREARVLEAVGARKEARAIQVLAQLPVNDGDVGLVTPYCPGKLFEGSASPHDVLRQAVQLCEAIMAWHAAGVLHLDLKPSNVATTADGDVVVLDAGISKFMTDGSVSVRGAVGTPGYMPPELRGDGSHVAVAACDVFSLGVTYRRALDRWAKDSRYSKRRASAAMVSKLRDVCETMRHTAAAKRMPLPEVLTKLQALASL